MRSINDEKDLYEHLSKLLLDENFRKLEQQKRFNIFDVLKIARTEIRHSNVLAWLLDPNEDHGLGNRVLNELVLMLIRDGHIQTAGADRFLLAKYEEVTVYRERKNIDILIESVKDKFVICIENKIDTNDHSNQLNKYDQYVKQTYKGYHILLLYLTPNGDPPTEETDSVWTCLDYARISDCIEKSTYNAPISEKVSDFIAYYQDVLRREIMDGDKKLQEVCREIYRQHKAVLDMIYEYRPDNVQNVSEVVREWCKEKEGKGLIIFAPYQKNQSKCYCRFRDEKMDAIVLDKVGRAVENTKSGWKGKNQYFYEIILSTNANGDVNYGLKLTFCCDGLTEGEKSALGALYKALGGNSTGVWKDFKSTAMKNITINNTDSLLADEDALRKTVFAGLDKQWKLLKEKIEKLEK